MRRRVEQILGEGLRVKGNTPEQQVDVALMLAHRYKAKIALVSRRAFPERGQWEHWLSEHDGEDAVSGQIAKLLEMEAAGGEVLAFTADVADETKPLAGQGADQALAFTVIADGAACRVDPGGEGGFGNDPAGPHRVQHVVPADNAAAVANEVFEKIEHLRLHRHDDVAVPKLPPLGIERVFVENKYHS